MRMQDRKANWVTNEVNNQSTVWASAGGVVEVSLAVGVMTCIVGRGIRQEIVAGIGEGVAEADDRSEATKAWPENN